MQVMSSCCGAELLCALAAAALALPAQAKNPRDAVHAWRVAHEREIVSDFSTFLAMPDVATNVADVEKNAAYIQAQLQARGFKTQILHAAPGTPPSVFAEYDTPGAKRTVVFYAHYDGQPVGQKGWINPPFEPTMRTAPPQSQVVDWKTGPIDPSWRLYARAAGDDKASIQALICAFDALKANHIKPSVNIKLLYEGEEEQCSPHFASLVGQNLALLKSDLLVMGDGPMHQSGKQMVNFGNRGIASFTLNNLERSHLGRAARRPLRQLGAVAGGDAGRAHRECARP